MWKIYNKFKFCKLTGTDRTITITNDNGLNKVWSLTDPCLKPDYQRLPSLYTSPLGQYQEMLILGKLRNMLYK